MLNVAVLVSGGGTNLQALIDAKNAGELTNANFSLVLSSKENVFALERAKNAGISTKVVLRNSFASAEPFNQAILQELTAYKIDIIVLAGFLSILGESIIKAYPKKIINVHPSLIPSFCGDGFYGITVHEQALKKGVKVSGATVHFVNEIADDGEIILQKAVYVNKNDTPETLQKRIMEQAEWDILPKALNMLCNGEI